MRHKLLVLFLLLAAVVPASFADDKAVNPDDVLLTEDADDIEGCNALGKVNARSGFGGNAVQRGMDSVNATLRKRAAAKGANVVMIEAYSTAFGVSGNGTAYACSDEAIEKQQAKMAELVRKASATITCTAGTDCEVRWSRVTLWLQKHSTWKFRNVTDTLITTEGPLETENKPAFEVTKVPTGDGKTYRITMRGFCANDCDKLVTRLRASFYDELTAPIEGAQ